ncbi:helicase [Ktedonobacter sp. SOSP1-52]|uniref:helicase-related protein n=1 Tax=Ktedonobacter sp. SOSP1-52 TaxID=2778366 RepID=UPI001916A5AA|nr:helicase-related protein [Ktedonobacter sp. SOSP1-52]GHO67432.1 helicase [Ktedonobacter sp. SOSP1-52]
MASLEDLVPGVILKGILPHSSVTLLSVRHHGSIGAELVYQDARGKTNAILLYQENMAELEVVPPDLPWSFAADGALFRLVSEAYRISLAYLFDPLLAVHTSLIEPLPHQITAVYETMLNKQPLRYLLADDPGAGKTIMTGLLIRELMLRGDLHRCLIVAPGNLVEQWQDELRQRFHVTFEILTNDRMEAAVGNTFTEIPLCIARLDKLARDPRLQELLEQSEWDLIVVDEAHKMSASFTGGEVKYTKRYQLGELLGRVTRHLLLLSATPHNGKEEDFQLFMRLLDADRFEGRFRDGVHKVEVSDLMRHLVKEQLYKFDGTPLFPERLAYTANYQLSGLEETLYREVTDYVREEFNRADALENHGRKGTVGFALTTLQRRLASSPEAIYQSLKRRRERLERRAQELQAAKNGVPQEELTPNLWSSLPTLSSDDLDDLDDAPGSELEEIEERLVDQASAARTLAELELEISILTRLEALALQVRRSGTDRKWEELASLLHKRAMFNTRGQRFKLVIFTEHRDTLNYLSERICTMLGQPEAVVTIHGGLSREERGKAQTAFTHDPSAHILIATDAAGEGINLQRAHLMVNYDLPWNPNRIEQRFGRIHRIGQTEVCHLWNLVAAETREGAVFHTLLKKLEEERTSLGGQVFDVLGKVLFDNRPLRELMVEAIRYGERPDVRARLTQVVDEALDHEHLQNLLEERALAHEVMDAVRVFRVRAEMERAAARRLQPHFIASFFLAAFKYLGGQCHEREPKRYEITHVPQSIRNRGGRGQGRATIVRQYERVVFDKERIQQEGQPPAVLLCPGHPLLDATLEILLEQQRDLLTQGAVLVDPTDASENLRVLFYLEHTIQDASSDSHGRRREVSRQLQFVEMNVAGELASAGYAPFLDYRPLHQGERELVTQLLAAPWLKSNLEEEARSYAIRELVPRHLEEVRKRREEQIDKTSAAVNERLTREISYWDKRAVHLKAQAAKGKPNALVNSQQARQRAEELNMRLERRLSELEQERKLSPLPPIVVGGVLVVPQGLLDRLQRESGNGEQRPDALAHETRRVELAAMQAVMQIERQLGYVPRDVSSEKCGYDIESSIPGSGKLRFIEVKGRVKGARSVIVTKNEILTALNRPDDFILALVEVDGEQTSTRYVTRPFKREPDFGATSVTYDLTLFLSKGVSPL